MQSSMFIHTLVNGTYVVDEKVADPSEDHNNLIPVGSIYMAALPSPVKAVAASEFVIMV